MVKVNGEFWKYTKLGEELAIKLCMGWKVTTIVEDRFGNGLFEFMKKGRTTIYVPFEELNTNDEVEITFNKLGELRREF